MRSPVITISWNQCPEIYHAAAAISTTVKNSGPIDRPLHEELCLRLFIFFFCHHDIVRLDFFIAILIDAKLLVHFLFRSAEIDADHCTDRDHDTGNCLNHIGHDRRIDICITGCSEQKHTAKCRVNKKDGNLYAFFHYYSPFQISSVDHIKG